MKRSFIGVVGLLMVVLFAGIVVVLPAIPSVIFCDVSIESAVVPLLVCRAKAPEESPVTTAPPPPVVNALIVVVIHDSYKIIQRLPTGTVTDAPAAIVIGPTLIAL